MPILLKRKATHPEIAIWRNDCVAQIAEAFNGRAYTVIDIENVRRPQLIPLFISLLLSVCALKNLMVMFNLCKYTNSINKSSSKKYNNRIILLKRFLRTVLDVSTVLSTRSKLLITFTDNAERYQAIDQVLYKVITVITIQNGSRYYVYQDKCGPGYSHFFHKPSFHSCFCTLGNLDAELHRNYGWTVVENHPVGSISADFALRRLGNSIESGADDDNPDIFLVLNSDIQRDNSIRLGQLLKVFAASRDIKIIAGIKPSKSGARFTKYYQDALAQYGDFVRFSFNSDRSENLHTALKAKVIIGSYSTLLREAFSFGKKIYPINFGPTEFNCHFQSLGINFAPTQEEFNHTLDSLLRESQHDYFSRMERQIAWIGAFPQDIRPIERLAVVINNKLSKTRKSLTSK